VERTAQQAGVEGARLTRIMVLLYQMGWSLREIAREYGFTSQGVRYRLQRAGGARRSRSEGNRFAWQWRPRVRSASWRGGRSRHSAGYILVYAPDHPEAVANGYVMEHRLIMEATLGRFLEPHEIVHHVNGKRDDNRPENLQLVQSVPEHMALHRARGGP
jgi:hypothetical protein